MRSMYVKVELIIFDNLITVITFSHQCGVECSSPVEKDWCLLSKKPPAPAPRTSDQFE